MSFQLRRRSRRLSRSAEGNLGALPTDLILEILSRLPAKSIARCRCVSKLWASLLKSPDFTELFLTQSKTRPRLLFTIRRKLNEWCLYSCPQPQISDKNPESSLSVTAEIYMSPLKHSISEMSPSISGLIYSPRSQVLCNPSTRRILRLPHPASSVVLRSFFGYDPIDKQFSVLALCLPVPPLHSGLPLSYQILKLGSGNLSWRSLDCSLPRCPSQFNICINGIVYFHFHAHKIVSFDLNSEEFKFIDQPWYDQPNRFVNFKGKLGGINKKWKVLGEDKSGLELSLWVLEDVEKQEWSKHVYFLPSTLWNTELEPYHIVGMTATGEVVLSLSCRTNLLYVYFFNLENNILRKVVIKGVRRLFKCYFGDFDGCVDYVEELRVLS